MRKHLILAAFLSTFLTGCVVATTPYYSGTVVREVHAAPIARYENPGYPPVVGSLWIAGDWVWVGRRHEWRPGHWVAPRHEHRWVAPIRSYGRHDHHEHRHEARRGWRDAGRDAGHNRGRHEGRHPGRSGRGDWR